MGQADGEPGRRGPDPLVERTASPDPGYLDPAQRTRDEESYEFDIIAHNGQEIVIAEVKTTLRVGHIEAFIKRLKKAKGYMPEYEARTVLGAIAYLRAEEASDQHAQNRGLFVIRATGNSAFIVNPEDFQPRKFG